MIDIKLHTLLAVAELKSFTKAAEQLSLTQPAVSQHIKQLEKELNIRIFNRVGNEIKPTTEGEIAIKYAKRMVALYDSMKQNILMEKHHAKKLNVGITHTAESNAVAEAIGRYCYKNSNVTITIITGAINNLYEMLKNYELDLAVIEGKIQDKSVNSILLDTDSLMLVVSNNNPLAKKSMVTIAELKKERLILRRASSGTRNLFAAHLETNNISLDEFNIILEVDNIATIKDLIRRDIGVSILAKSACEDELKKRKLTVLPIENLSMIREINIIYHQDFEHTDILRDILREYNKTKNLNYDIR